jgi:hypothetical protein
LNKFRFLLDQQFIQQRQPEWGQKKRPHNISLTDIAWEGTQSLLKEKGYASLSEYLEFLGREVIPVPERPENIQQGS